MTQPKHTISEKSLLAAFRTPLEKAQDQNGITLRVSYMITIWLTGDLLDRISSYLKLHDRVMHAVIGTPGIMCAAVTCHYIFDADLVSIVVGVTVSYMVTIWLTGDLLDRISSYLKLGR